MSYTFVGLTPDYWKKIPDDARPHWVQDTTGVVAIDERGEMQGVACIDSWSKNSCKIHCTIFNPFILKHGFQEEVFNFIFNTAGRNIIIGSTPANNKRALKFNEHMGFKEIFRIKDGCEVGEDFVITELRKEDCRWINQEAERGCQTG